MSALPAHDGRRRYLGGMNWRICSVMLRIAAVVVAALHAGLLWQRVEDLSITEPEIIARWCAAAIAAAAALFLLHLRVSRRSWLVFWAVVVLLHAALPVEGLRLDVLIEAAFVIAPLILMVAGRISAFPAGSAPVIDQKCFALPIDLLTASLLSRAPPSRRLHRSEAQPRNRGARIRSEVPCAQSQLWF